MNKIVTKFLQATFVINSAVFGSVSAAATPFVISNIGLWRAKSVEESPLIKRLFGKAEAVLVPSGETENKPAVIMERIEHKTEGRDRAIDFRELIVGKSADRLIVNERAYTQNKQARYVVEYVNTTATDIPIRTIVLAVKVGNDIVTFTYENAEPVYKSNIDSVRLLMKSVTVKNKG